MKCVAIIGMGFGGLSAAQALASQPDLEVVLIDRNNYHLFTPLLYQVATASIEQEAIAYPVRAIARGWKNSRFHLAEVEAIDLDARTLTTSGGAIVYDYLIVAAGAVTNFLGVKGVEKHGYVLKTLADAVTLRNHVLSVFEEATREADPAQRAALLTFVAVGGGPSGVEYCGALAELVQQVMRQDYPEVATSEVTIILLEATANLLPMVPPGLRGYTFKRLHDLGVEVRIGAKVVRAEARRVLLNGGESIACGTLLWVAGVQAPPLADGLAAPKARAGRIAVAPDLTLPDHPEVAVVGDMAWFEQAGAPLPTVAQVAIQMGAYAARGILRRIRGEATLAPFRYTDLGTMAVIGRGAAVADVFGARLSGFIAWLAWLGLHITTLIGFRNRLLVLINWAYDYLFFDRKIRLITWTRKGTHTH
jgi:NADH dehydrogenase